MIDRPDIDILTDRVEAIACRKCGARIPLEGLDPFSDVACAACSTRQKVPVRLGQFLLVERLGKGGMGAVYKGLDQTLGRYVAFKVMRKEFGDDAGALENFLREARAAAALNHRNVVQIYSCGKEKGQPFIVMELVGGGRLDTLMEKKEPLNELKVMQIAVDVAQGLGAAHDIGLVHGDIKPANILFDRDSVAKVVDFGLARFVASQQAPGEVWGTPYYIAPEKVRKQPEDHRSDIYSLGATLFHALCAHPPFDGKTATDVVLARLDAPAPHLREVRKDLHPETADVIARMIEEDPGRRYPTYASLLSDLRAAEREARSGPMPVEPEKKSRMTWAIVALAVALLIGGGLFAGVHYAKRKSASEPVQKKPTRHILVGNKIIPVYDEEVASEGPTTPPSETVEETPPPDSAAPPPPLSAEHAEAMGKALDLMAGGEEAEAAAALNSLVDQLAPEDPERAWVRFGQGLVALLQGDNERARETLSEVRNAQVPEGGDAAHPVTVARTLSRFLLGDLDEIALFAAADAWPVWAKDLVPLSAGVRSLTQGRLEEARASLQDYAGKTKGDPSWAYALQPVARARLELIASWDAERKRSDDLLDQQKADDAVAALERYRAGSPPFLHAPIDDLLRRSRDAVAKATAEQEKEHAQIQTRLQADLDRIDSARESVAALVAAKQFTKAASDFDKQLEALETAEGLAWKKRVTEGYRRMEELKGFLVEAVQSAPFGDKAARELGGAAVGANRGGIKVSLGGHGDTLRPWEQVSTRLFVWMAEQYAGGAGLSESERAARLTELALFCYEGGGFEPAAKYARQAAALGDAARADVEYFMPDILGP